MFNVKERPSPSFALLAIPVSDVVLVLGVIFVGHLGILVTLLAPVVSSLSSYLNLKKVLVIK